MKIFTLVLCLLVGSSYAIPTPILRPDVRANINDYVDILLKTAKDFMINNGLDPLTLPDFERTFSAEDLIGVVWHGELTLNHGVAKDISTIYRSGDVNLGYENKTMYLTAEMGFRDLMKRELRDDMEGEKGPLRNLQLDYDFSAKIMDIGPAGQIHGQANDVILEFKAKVDLTNKTAQLEDFKIKTVGQIEIQFKGLGTVLDWMMDAISKIVIDLFKGPVINKVEEVIREVLVEIIGSIDIGDFLPSL